MTPLLAVNGLCKRYGAVVAADRIDLEVAHGEIHAVIGPNGAGKTTLVGQLAGEIRPDQGRITFCGQNLTPLPASARASLGIARSFQVTCLFEQLTVLDNVALAVQAVRGHSFRFWRPARRVRGQRDAAREVLIRVGLADAAELAVGALAHGQKRQLELAMAIASRPRLLLLDEPLAGHGVAEAPATIRLLGALREDHAMLLVEHDMDAVFALADRITVLVGGRVIASGAPASIRTDPGVRAAYLGDARDS